MSFINDIKGTWKESLTFYKWSELKTLGLVTLNTFRRAAGLLIGHFWWLFLAIAVGSYFTSSEYTSITHMHYFDRVVTIRGSGVFDLIVHGFVTSFLFFISFLAVRASTERKDTTYFLNYLPRIIGYVLLISLASLLFFIPTTFRVFINFAIFFFLDAEYSLKNIVISIFNGLKMVIYFFPFIMIFPFMWYLIVSFGFLFTMLGLTAGSMAFGSFVAVLSNPLIVLGGFLIMQVFNVLWLSLVSALYIKIKHGNYRLFFKS